MGFRFRKSVSIIPGVRLNISKTGLSTSIGKRGATINLSSRGGRGTVGIPGSGLSYSQKLWGSGRKPRANGQSSSVGNAPPAGQPGGCAQNTGCLIIVGLIGLGVIGSAFSRGTSSKEVSDLSYDNQAQDVSIIAVDTANCRSQAGKDGEVLTRFDRGSAIEPLRTQNGWSEVPLNSAEMGAPDTCWISNTLIATQ